MCAEPHRKIGERSLEILESAIDREDLLVDCAPLRDGGGIEGADGRPSTCVEINRCGSGARRAELRGGRDGGRARRQEALVLRLLPPRRARERERRQVTIKGYVAN